MYKKLFPILAAITIGFTLIPDITLAAQPFYEGKVIRLIVGYSPGGGFDTYARIIARHMGKHIPGNPTIIVENMPGAGGMILANHLYNVANPDGLTIGHFSGMVFMGKILGQEGAKFDFNKFEYIGAPVGEVDVIVFSKASGITSMEKWTSSKTPVKVGVTSSTNFPLLAILKSGGIPLQVIEGYKGTSECRLAVESGEVAGTALSWESVKMGWRKALEKGDVIVVLQSYDKIHPDLPNVPLAINFAKTEEVRQLIKLIGGDLMYINRPLTLPPGTPKEQVQILRKAFYETMEDKELLGETEKAKIDIRPLTIKEVEEIVRELSNMKPNMVDKVKEIFLYKK